MSMVNFPLDAHSTTNGSMIVRVIFSCTGVTFFMIQVAAFAVYFGNLGDHFVSDLLINTSAVLQSTSFGWWISYFVGGTIMLGPMDYFIQLSMWNPNYDLLISIMGIYFISSIFIGMNMRHYHPVGGFLLGFCAIAFFNIVIYLVITQFSSLLSNYGVDASTVEMIKSVVDSILSGTYGEPTAQFLFRGIFINGVMMGVFGAFWTAILMPSKARIKDLVVKVKCPTGNGTCVVPPVQTPNGFHSQF